MRGRSGACAGRGAGRGEARGGFEAGYRAGGHPRAFAGGAADGGEVRQDGGGEEGGECRGFRRAADHRCAGPVEGRVERAVDDGLSAREHVDGEGGDAFSGDAFSEDCGDVGPAGERGGGEFR